jgi:small-conductance mechanosensitive channel/CRP-like cAMP-binding protein
MFAAGLTLLVVTLIVRLMSASRHVRGRLVVSAFFFGVYALGGAVLAYGGLSAQMREQLGFIQPLLFAFGLVNAVIALALNPWKIDRIPDRFPTIVQDAIVIALFALAAAFILQDRIFATTAVGAVVIGFALQDTLGNLFAGLAIQIEKPFRVGHWVTVAGSEGLVTEVTWRATKLRTRAGNFVIVPNSSLAKETIVNYSEPERQTRLTIDIGVSYEAHPNDVKAVIVAAIAGEPLLDGTRRPEVFIVDFAASSITYQVWVWTTRFADADAIYDRVRSAIYYAFKRANISIPFPIQVELGREDLVPPPRDLAPAFAALAAVPMFAALTDGQREGLARAARSSVYAAGETIIREGDEGSSMFVVVRGEVVVRIASGQEVARTTAGGYFGEMSLLTGAPRTATVAAAVDTELLEVTGDAFRSFVYANPAVLDQIGTAVAARQAELAARRAEGAAASAPEPEATLIARIRRFLSRPAFQRP